MELIWCTRDVVPGKSGLSKQRACAEMCRVDGNTKTEVEGGGGARIQVAVGGEVEHQKVAQWPQPITDPNAGSSDGRCWRSSASSVTSPSSSSSRRPISRISLTLRIEVDGETPLGLNDVAPSTLDAAVLGEVLDPPDTTEPSDDDVPEFCRLRLLFRAAPRDAMVA